jgi:MoaA/NifB/PqqE/SkfB family radical SAM enzyme
MSESAVTTLQDREFSRQLAAKLKGERFPLSGQWEITCRCNLRCVMCYTDCFNTPERIRQELTFEEIVRIMDELAAAGCLNLSLTGGEPLARKDFLDIYGYAKQKGFLVTVLTNGTLLTKTIADYWVKYPPSMIEISFHGFTKESFDQITDGRGSYERCLAAIQLLLERNLPLTLKTTGMTINRDEVLQIKEFVNRVGNGLQRNVHYKLGSEIRASLDGSEDVYRFQLSEKDVTALEQADPELRAERFRQDVQAASRPAAGCAGGHQKFHIDAYGQLQLCTQNRRESYDLRRGSFREGFYKFLPQFPCPSRTAQPALQLLSIARPSARTVNAQEPA